MAFERQNCNSSLGLGAPYPVHSLPDPARDADKRDERSGHVSSGFLSISGRSVGRPRKDVMLGFSEIAFGTGDPTVLLSAGIERRRSVSSRKATLKIVCRGAAL